ncbi:hypothetical protein C8035_v004238 [Colletotrichum spinosum]|uniref:Uncharacterized protein n=1 Tax=Colletotrichum spinosum TaxID=1347390 RepID=A0A4R8Q7G6_9PEZI|nr:hypothetical protein C8035_v004238 [Colletotrichum spinosum]
MVQWLPEMLVCPAVPRQSSTFRSGYGQAMDSRRKESFGGSIALQNPSRTKSWPVLSGISLRDHQPIFLLAVPVQPSVFDWSALAKRLGARRCLPSASSHIAASGLMRE